MSQVRTFSDRFARQALTDLERVLPVDGQLAAIGESLTGRYFGSPARPGRVVRVTFLGVGDPPAWLDSAIRDIGDMARLPNDWDSYGAASAQVESIIGALEAVALAMNANASRPTIVPTKRGGIQLEWHDGNRTLEFIADRDARRVFFVDDRTGEEWETDYRQAPDRVMAILRDFHQ